LVNPLVAHRSIVVCASLLAQKLTHLPACQGQRCCTRVLNAVTGDADAGLGARLPDSAIDITDDQLADNISKAIGKRVVATDSANSVYHGRPFLSKGVLGICCDKTGMKKKKPETWGLGPGGAEGGTFESESAATEDYHAADAIILESMLAPLDIALECVARIACLVVGHLHRCPSCRKVCD
jgi:hypothetical protein